MKIADLKPAPGSRKKAKRVGRGTSSGHGKTSGRGHKGQKSRSGGVKGPGFEGGQTPLYRRLPKRTGFKNFPFKKEYLIINLRDLDYFNEGEVVNRQKLIEAGFIRGKKRLDLPIKILGQGEFKKKLTVEAQKFSKGAKTKIESLGGIAKVC